MGLGRLGPPRQRHVISVLAPGDLASMLASHAIAVLLERLDGIGDQA